MKKLSLILFAFILLPPVSGKSFAHIDSNDRVYPFLEQAWAGGYIRYLPQTRPYTHETAALLLTEAIDSANRSDGKMPAWIARTARQHLDRLSDPRNNLLRYDFGQSDFVSLDTNIEFGLDSSLGRMEDTIIEGVGPFGISIGLGDSVFLGLSVLPALAYWGWTEEPYPLYGEPVLSDYYHYVYPIESGSGSFGHGGYHELGAKELRILFDTFNQFSIDLDYIQLHAGRDALDWGPGRVANLVLSKTAKAYDYLALQFPLGRRGRFSWMTGILQNFAYGGGTLDERLLTAHRLEYQIADWLYLAIYESVVYDFTFELAYLNPLAIYYVTEVTQGSDDNKLGGADAVVLLPPVKLYISFFADDWDAGRLFAFNNSHNEWAAIFGAQYAGLYPGLNMLLEYTYLSHWMYTHFTWSDISSPGRSYQHYGSHLGHFLDPNSHMLYFESSFDFDAVSWITFSFWFAQNGRGDINTPPDWAEESTLHGVGDHRDIYYSFLDRGKPGFAITTDLDWSVSGSYTFPAIGLTLHAKYSIQYGFSQNTEDLERVAGSEDVQHFITCTVNWNPGALRVRSDDRLSR